MLRTKHSSVLRCSLNSIRRHESNDPKKPQAKGYYPLGNPARLWGPALQQTLINWAIPGALWMAAGVATVLYYTSKLPLVYLPYYSNIIILRLESIHSLISTKT